MTGSSGSMGSNTSHSAHHSSLVLSSFAVRGWSRHASRPHETRLGEQCHRVCERSPAGEQRHGECSVVDWCRCRFRRRVGSMPVISSVAITVAVYYRDHIPSLQRARIAQSLRLAQDVDYCPESRATRTVRRHLSCDQSCPVLGPVP